LSYPYSLRSKKEATGQERFLFVRKLDNNKVIKGNPFFLQHNFYDFVCVKNKEEQKKRSVGKKAGLKRYMMK